MSRWTTSCLLMVAISMFALPVAAKEKAPEAEEHRAVPTRIPFQGYLTDDLDAPIDNTVSMSVSLFDALTAGTLVWGPEVHSVDVSEGIFQVELGETVALDPADFQGNAALYLAVTVDGGDELSPRTQLLAAPFAMNAELVETGSSQWSTDGTHVYRPTGRVGIGTSAPEGALHVEGSAGGSAALFDSDYEYGTKLRLRNTGPEGTSWAQYSTGELNGEGGGWFVLRNEANGHGMKLDPLGRLAARSATFAETLRVPTAEISSSLTVPSLTTTGTLTAPQFIAEDDWEYGTSVRIRNTDVGGTEWALVSTGSLNGEGAGWLTFWNGATGSYAAISPTGLFKTLALDVAGNAAVDVLTIRGGADIVEGFDTADDADTLPGTVMVIDPSNPGALRASDRAYDAKVAGVVSGAGGVQPGIRLGQDGVLDGSVPVAMTGRVYVRCSAENGSITPGDLITTAGLAGHGMKATDRDRSHGAVIGKAMSSLDDGSGLVLVLVNLQ